MRLNNGSAKGGGKSTSNRGSSANTPREQYQVSDNLFVVEERMNDEIATTSRGLRLNEHNDLRNGRAVTPAMSVDSSRSNTSTVRTRQSNLSEHFASTISGTGSGIRNLRSRSRSERKETFSSEPHPYGLVPAVSPVASPPQASGSVRVVQRTVTTETYLRGSSSNTTSSSSRETFNERNARAVARANNVATRFLNQGEEYGYRNSSSTSGAGSGSHHTSDDNSPYNSDAELDSSPNASRVQGRFSAATFIKSAVESTINFVKYGFAYIYFFLMGVVFVEKWLLYVRRGPTIDGHTTRQHGVSQELENDYSGSSRSTNQGFTVTIFSNIVNSSQSIRNRFTSMWQGSRVRVFLNGTGSSVVDNQNTCASNSTSTAFAILKKALAVLFRIALVMLLIFLFWKYGGAVCRGGIYAGEQVCTGIAGAFKMASSAFSTMMGVVSLWMKSLFTRTPQTSEVIQPLKPSSAKTENPISITAATSAKESETAQLVLTSIQNAIDALKLQIDVMEKAVGIHETRLNSHDDSIQLMKTDISTVIAAMKAASAKEKSMDQIITEVLNVKIGETTEGNKVTLGTMFNVLNDKEDRKRISEELEIKLRSIAENIANNEETFAGIHSDVVGVKDELNQMNVRVLEVTRSVEKRDTKVDIDLDKIKEIIVPVLASEIEKTVALSCESRNCPESSPYAGLSIEDIELMIKRAIAMYDADKTGLPDLALESAGGSILSTRCTKSSELRNSVISYWGFRLWSPPNTPRTIIQPGVVPGECWAFEGSVGDVVIKLAVPSVVTGFTLEHIPKSVSRYGHIDSAPKHFQVLGLQSEHDAIEVHDYGSFIYEDKDESLQYFPVSNMTTKAYPIVELKVLSNHGNMKHTCIYRFRVHGAIDLGRSQRGGKSEEEVSRK